MNECTNSSIYLGEFKIKLTSTEGVTKINNLVQNFKSCNLNYFSKNDQIIMSYCPFWWEDLWKITLSYWVIWWNFFLNNSIQTLKSCKKIK